jgi:1-deoxy-D-xylulose 5-phosphate reductoisomerase
VAVAGFLAGRCGFMEVPRLIGDALDAHAGASADDLGACLALDGAVRRSTEAALGSVPAGSALN